MPRFDLGLIVLLCAAAMTVLYYDRLLTLLPQLGSTDLTEDVKRQIAQSAELMRDPRLHLVAVVSAHVPVRDRSAAFSLFHVMSAEPYFRGTGLPSIGMLVSVGLSVGFFYAAHSSFARRDF